MNLSNAQAQTKPAAAAIGLESVTNQIGRYEKLEFRIQGLGNYANPFDPEEAEVSLRLTAPGGQSLTLPAFYCQDYERRRVGPAGRQRDWIYPAGTPAWKARFAPMDTGEYEAIALVKGRDREKVERSQPIRFTCLPSRSRGFVRVSQRDPRFLEFSQGQPFFPIGQNLAFIGNQQYVNLSKAEGIFGELAENGANYLRIWACCEDWAMAIEARKSAWGRSWDWRPPIVLAPETGGPERKCLKLSSSKPVLKVEPSHPVALRPRTRYLLSGQVRTEAGAALELECSHIQAKQPLVSTPEGPWAAFKQEFETGPDDFWLGNLSFRLKGSGTAWLGELSLKEAAGGPELLWEAAVDRPARGFYNPLDCFMLDEIIASAERHGIYLQLCLLTRDLYMGALKEPASGEYERAMQDAKKFFRYAIGRWGYSTSVGAWEYWNEMDPGRPTDRFYTSLGEYFEQADIYHHLRTTSTWGPSAKDCRHAKLDLADTHFYLRPSDKGRLADEVEAVIDRTRWLREQAPSKPAHLGEFGLADEKWGLTAEMRQSRVLADVHNALWASALSGASGTAMFWWWERLDQHGGYAFYRPLSRFIADVPWTSGAIQPAAMSCSDARVRTVGLRADDRAWLWLFNREASWGSLVTEKRTPATVSKAGLELKGLPAGSYQIRWWDTVQGTVIREEKRAVQDGALMLSAPDFERDIAASVSHE